MACLENRRFCGVGEVMREMGRPFVKWKSYSIQDELPVGREFTAERGRWSMKGRIDDLF